MIFTVKRHEACARYEGSQRTAFFKWDGRVIARVQYERRRLNLGRQFDYIYLIEGALHPSCILRRRRDLQEFVEPAALFFARSRHEECGKKLAKSRIVPAPADANAVDQSFRLCFLLRSQPPVKATARVPTIENEMADALWVARSISDRHRRPLRDAQERKAFNPDCLDDGLQITDPGVDREIRCVPVRKAAPSFVSPLS